jgi:hypothetical protein
MTAEEELAEATASATVSAADVPTTAQKAKDEEGGAPAAAGAKGEAKPAAGGKDEKKEKK